MNKSPRHSRQEEDIPACQVVSLDVVARERVDFSKLQESLALEKLLFGISARLITASLKEIDQEIIRALRQIREFFRVDHCGLLEVDKDKRIARVSHAAYTEGVGQVSGEINLAALFPWSYEKLFVQGYHLNIQRIVDLPPQADTDRQSYLTMGVRAALNIPLVTENRLFHSMVIQNLREERTLPDEFIPRLRLLGEIIVTALVRKQADLIRLEQGYVYLQKEVKSLLPHGRIVGQSAAMKSVISQAMQVARTDSTVLILGETGTGKELLARTIHEQSKRKGRPLITVNCASLPPALIEAELFGREKGAYTGALSRNIGRFELADESTIFLDEIGELPLELQAKLLRVLEFGSFERLGSSTPITINLRIISATNRALSEDVKAGTFRSDLYYRLNVFPIEIPPLRERPEDIPLLVWALVKEFQESMGRNIERISEITMKSITSYGWPGNVRELRNVIERAMIVSTGRSLDVTLPKKDTHRKGGPGETLEEVERGHIMAVLSGTRWRITGKGGAAEILGLERTTLYSKMKKLGISRSVT